jgi:cysteine desulfurase
MIYLDNNATTSVSPAVNARMVECINLGNPSASYASAKKARKIMESFRADVSKVCDFGDKYEVIITSCASESNSHIITRVIDSYLKNGIIPHIISSAIEHKSVINTLDYHIEMGRATVSYIKPAPTGHILPADILREITANTALICVMTANNEIGAVNDIESIGKLAHSRNIPFYTDAVQSFGKYGLLPIKSNVDGFAISAHKFGGSLGCALLVLKREWIEGYGINALIFGTQNGGLRGGTENIPAIAGMQLALKIAMTNRKQKNDKMLALKKYIFAEIAKRAPARSYTDYLNKPSNNEVEIVFFDESLFRKSALYLPNTLFISIIKRSAPAICNVKFKGALERDNIIISVGSACNTSSDKASHVLYALGADELIRKGALRISLGDATTKEQCTAFIKSFLCILANCVKQNHLTK